MISPSSEVYSISLWVKFDRSDDGGTLFGQYQDPNEYFWHKWGRYNHQTGLTPETIGVDEFFPSGGALSKKISPGLALGKWHHVVIARDPATLHFYLDGDLIGEWPYDESYQLRDKNGCQRKSIVSHNPLVSICRLGIVLFAAAIRCLHN